jgi:hypothetical protein
VACFIKSKKLKYSDKFWKCWFTFQEVHLSGQAQLALYRVNGQTFTQSITVNKTVGDKSGMWHVGK